MNADSLIKKALDTVFFFDIEGEDEAVIPVRWLKGDSELVLLLGPNASGKSLFRRVVQAHKDEGSRFMGLSMEDRASNLMGVAHAFVYGDEQTLSTGGNSAGTVLGGIRSAKKWDEDHIVFWDEPDIGLSDENAAGIGGRASSSSYKAFPRRQRRCSW